MTKSEPPRKNSDSPPDPDHLDRLLAEQEAAAFLDLSVRALQNWRVRGGGPPYVRISRRCIRYRRRDLIAFSEERLEAHTSATATALEPASEQPRRQVELDDVARERRSEGASEGDPLEDHSVFGPFGLMR